MSSTGNNTVVYATFQDFVSESSFTDAVDRLQDMIAKGKSDGSLSPLSQLQYDIQLEWVQKGRVPHLENIMFSRGMINLEPGVSYCLHLSGIQVCFMAIRHVFSLIFRFASIPSAGAQWSV